MLTLATTLSLEFASLCTGPATKLFTRYKVAFLPGNDWICVSVLVAAADLFTQLAIADVQGQIEEARNDASLFRVLYDDDAAEWLSLADEQFKLLTPRGKTAGCSSALKVCNHRCARLLSASNEVRKAPQYRRIDRLLCIGRAGGSGLSGAGASGRS